MLFPGKYVKFNNKEAIVLVCKDDEVLLFIDSHTVKWVDVSLFKLLQTA